jgi:hypothetical protein
MAVNLGRISIVKVGFSLDIPEGNTNLLRRDSSRLFSLRKTMLCHDDPKFKRRHVLSGNHHKKLVVVKR